MKKGIDKFLTSDKVLYSLPWIFAVVVVVLQIAAYMDKPRINYSNLGIGIINLLFVCGILISYKKHEKNIMKTLFGAVMSGRIISMMQYVSNSIEKFGEYPERALAILPLIFYILLLVNHLILGYGHKASPDRVSINRVVGFLIIVTTAVWNFATLDSIFLIIMWILFEIVIVIEILCIETKVDAYKIIRESK